MKPIRPPGKKRKPKKPNGVDNDQEIESATAISGMLEEWLNDMEDDKPYLRTRIETEINRLKQEVKWRLERKFN